MLLQSLYFSHFLPNHPRPLSSFDTHARWQPVTQSARSRRSYGKIGACEQSIILIIRKFLWIFAPLFNDGRTFSVRRTHKKNMETVDWRPWKIKFQQRGKKTLWGRMVLLYKPYFHLHFKLKLTPTTTQHNNAFSGSTSTPAVHDFWEACLLQHVSKMVDMWLWFNFILGLNFINFSFVPKPLTYITIPKHKRK